MLSIFHHRTSIEYRQGAWNFVQSVKKNLAVAENFLCPCIDCRNLTHHHDKIVFEHLVIKGMDPKYKCSRWYNHGEQLNIVEEMDLNDTYDLFKVVHYEDEDFVDHTFFADDKDNVDAQRREDDLIKKLEDAESPLYPDCAGQTKLSAITALYNLKCECGLSDTGFDKLLNVVHVLLPKDNVLPKTIYEVKKFLKIFDMGFEKIHACKNDCCLFRKEYKDLNSCPKCGSSRWKINKSTKEIMQGIPVKVLRYFPIIPKFKRMFRSKKMAEDLRWHYSNKINDGKMRHPMDSVTWNVVDEKYKSFSADPRNLRLGLATDGFNPFAIKSYKYSCWPVMLVTYNLPPMLCMKEENIMLTLVIPGPKQPGNDIDIYMAPLVEDLHHLWHKGVDIYDAFSKTLFNLKAILLWTINDFSAYGNLAGCCVKGKKACPLCGVNTHSRWLNHSRKIVYMGHR